MKRSERQQRRTAYHEAGHAVLQWALGVGIKLVTIVPDYDAGTAEHATKKMSFHEHTLEVVEEAVHQRSAVILLAGRFAQEKFDAALGNEGCNSDYLEAGDHIEQLCYTEDDKENAAWWTVLEARCRALVEHYWPEITALADALLEKETMDRDSAEDIVLKTLNNRRGTWLR